MVSAARIHGELCFPPTSLPDFILYANSLERWEPPHDTVPLGAAERDAILNCAAEEIRASGMTAAIEWPPA